MLGFLVEGHIYNISVSFCCLYDTICDAKMLPYNGYFSPILPLLLVEILSADFFSRVLMIT